MKKILLIIAAILCLSACTKEPVLQGVYSCTMSEGTLNVELLANEKCILYFNGGKESTGFWHTYENDEISIIGSVEYGDISSYKYRYYRFGDHGKIINDTEFSVPAKEIMKDKDVTCRFIKRY